MRILYVEGDIHAPRFVTGALKRAGHRVDRVVSADPTPWYDDHHVVILADTPASTLGGFAATLADAVDRGRGLLVCGGLRGLGSGGYASSPLAPTLPVTLLDRADRVRAPSGVYLAAATPHPVLDGLPLDRPPVLASWHLVEPRGDAHVALLGRVVETVDDAGARFGGDPVPLLVTGTHGQGRVAVYASDLTPPGSGGLTAWGHGTVVLPDGPEVGDAWATFVDQLVRWLAGDVGGALQRRSGVGTEVVA